MRPGADPRAVRVAILVDAIELSLADGRRFVVPLTWFPRLLHASASHLQHWRLTGEGRGVQWPDLDLDLAVADLLDGVAPRVTVAAASARMPLGRAMKLALAWQALPVGGMLFDGWNSPSSLTLVLRSLVFLVVPMLSGVVHRSGLVLAMCLLVPVFGMGVMMTVFMLLMPAGKW